MGGSSKPVKYSPIVRWGFASACTGGDACASTIKVGRNISVAAPPKRLWSRGRPRPRGQLNCNLGRGFEQSLGISVLRILRDLLGGIDLDDLAAIHDRDARRKIAHHRHRVRDEEVGESEVALQLRQQIYDLRADADVEGGDGFVAHDELGLQSQSAGDDDALALASAELVRVAAAGGGVEADGAEEFVNARRIPRRRKCTGGDARAPDLIAASCIVVNRPAARRSGLLPAFADRAN